MNSALHLKRLMEGLRKAQPLDPPQNLIVFPNGRAMAVCMHGDITFESFEQIERVVDYHQRHNQGLNGEGI